jgi:hypothetical protein
MSVSDPEEKIEWGADRDSELRKNERVPSSGVMSSEGFSALKKNAVIRAVLSMHPVRYTSPAVESNVRLEHFFGI